MQRCGNSEAGRLAKEGAEPFRIAAADRQLLTGDAEFVRRVGVYCASQQAECRDLCSSDHVDLEWLSYVLLDAIPGLPLPGASGPPSAAPGGPGASGRGDGPQEALGNPASEQLPEFHPPPSPGAWIQNGHALEQ
eukprot:5097657-Pyramimonas_sp.AAC.1